MTAEASTLKSVFFKRRALIARTKIAGLVALTLLSAFPGRTYGAPANSCIPEPGVLDNYIATNPATAVPQATFLRADGSETSLTAMQGTGLVINFWATWCAPCVREMPQLDRLSAFVKDNGIEVLAISEDRKALNVAPKFYKTHNLKDLPVLADPKGRLMRAFKAPGLPLTVLVNTKGEEVGRVVGPAEWDSIEIVDFVRQCLGK